MAVKRLFIPATTTAAELLADNPDGIMLSPGPGDPENYGYLVETVKELVGKKADSRRVSRQSNSRLRVRQ